MLAHRAAQALCNSTHCLWMQQLSRPPAPHLPHLRLQLLLHPVAGLVRQAHKEADAHTQLRLNVLRGGRGGQEET